MARKATGAVIEHVAADGKTYRSLRFTAYGKRRFVSLGPVSEAEAQRRLRHVMADVERGVWQPPEEIPGPEPVTASVAMPTFDEHAGQWWELNHQQWRPATVDDYSYRLQRILPVFGNVPLDQITLRQVQQFKADQLRAGLGPRTVNMTLILLRRVLQDAVDQEMIGRNPARGVKAKESRTAGSYLESPEQIEALLDAAAAMDATAREKRTHRRAILATLMFAGLRVGEVCELRWRDVDLPGGWIHVRKSKTDAGVRRIKLRGALRDELTAVRPLDAEKDAYVFGTRSGHRRGQNNLRTQILIPAVEKANAQLEAAGLAELPDKVTPHSLRRTFASVMFAIGEPQPIVMEELGHTSPTMTLGLYAKSMRLEPQQKMKLQQLVYGAEMADVGQIPVSSAKTPEGERFAA